MNPEAGKSARQWAIRALGRRMHTTHEIKTGLEKRGFSDETAGSVIEDLSRLGYLNDLDFTRAWVSSRSVQQLHGRLRLLRDLRLKGIPDEMAESVICELLTDEDEVNIATRAALKKCRILGSAAGASGSKSRERVYRHLKTRGFTTRIINLAMADITFEEDSS